MSVPNSSKINNTLFNELRPIHYLGSKLRVLDTIEQVIDSIEPTKGRICDLFSGSGTVSRHLSYTRPVTSVDIQEYSRVLCSTVLLTPKPKLMAGEIIEDIKESSVFKLLFEVFSPILEYEKVAMNAAETGDIVELYDIIENGSFIVAQKNPLCNSSLHVLLNSIFSVPERNRLLSLKTAMTTLYFGGLYFSYEQSVYVDATLEYIFTSTNDNLPLRDLLLAATISAISEIVNTVGKQFAQPLKVKIPDGSLKTQLLKKVLADRSVSFFQVFERWLQQYILLEPSPYINDHEIIRMNYCEALEIIKYSDISVVYADPPYTRYHYSRYYHVLETICLRDMPEVSTIFPNSDKLSRAIYRKERHQSPFSIRSKADAAFEELFKNVAELDVPFALSYSPFTENSNNTPRVQTIEQLIEKANRYYENVDRISPGLFAHSKLNTTDKNYSAAQEAELLIVCQKPKNGVEL